MATIRKLKSGLWNVQVRVKGYPHVSRSFNDEEDAKRWAGGAEQQIRSGVIQNVPVDKALPPAGKWTRRVWYRLTSSSKPRSERRGLEFTLTLKDLHSIAERAGGRCEVTGIPFSDHIPPGSKVAPYKPSVDRIDNSKGYTPDNVRLVCYAVNLAMNQWGEEVLRSIAKAYYLSPKGFGA